MFLKCRARSTPPFVEKVRYVHRGVPFELLETGVLAPFIPVVPDQKSKLAIIFPPLT